MPLTLGQLLSSSWNFFVQNIKTILIGAVIFAAILTTLQMLLAPKVEREMKGLFGSMGMDTDRMEDLAERIQAGDESAQQEMMEALGGMENQFEGMTEDEVGEMMMGKMFGMFKVLGPDIFLYTLVAFLVGFLAKTYYVLLALRGEKDPGSLLKMSFGVFLPLLGVSVWAFLRSFAWIPFLGIILAIILGPRFVLSPVILLKEGKGVMESVSQSYRRTQGYWGKIFGNLLVVGLCFVVLSMVAGMTLSFLGMIHPLVMTLGQGTVMQLLAAFAAIFVVHLSLTILEHPLVPAGMTAAPAKKSKK